MKNSYNSPTKTILIVLMISLMLCGCSNTTEQVSDDAVKLITSAGEYVIDESVSMPIVVNAPNAEVKLILRNADIAAIKGSAIDVIDALKVTIVAKSDTENTLEDAPRYEVGNQDKSCIHATCDLYIEGNGKLNIHSYHKSAIDAKDKLYIDNCDLYISSKNNGIKSNDGIIINNSALTVEAEKSSLVTDKIGKDNKGDIVINNSSISIIAGKYGIDSSADVIADNSELFINAVLGQFKAGGVMEISDNCTLNE